MIGFQSIGGFAKQPGVLLVGTLGAKASTQDLPVEVWKGIASICAAVVTGQSAIVANRGLSGPVTAGSASSSSLLVARAISGDLFVVADGSVSATRLAQVSGEYVVGGSQVLGINARRAITATASSISTVDCRVLCGRQIQSYVSSTVDGQLIIGRQVGLAAAISTVVDAIAAVHLAIVTPAAKVRVFKVPERLFMQQVTASPREYLVPQLNKQLDVVPPKRDFVIQPPANATTANGRAPTIQVKR